MKTDVVYLRHILDAIQKIESYVSVIPWRRIAGMRDVLIHDYMGVDLAAVWEVTQKELTGLKSTSLRITVISCGKLRNILGFTMPRSAGP